MKKANSKESIVDKFITKLKKTFTKEPKKDRNSMIPVD